MSPEEIEKIAYAATTVDNECLNCCEALIDKLTNLFPEVKWKENFKDDDIKEEIKNKYEDIAYKDRD